MVEKEPEVIVFDPKEGFVDFLKSSIAREMAIVVLGLCSVDYRGRAQSKLGEGIHVVFVKSDGAVLVHGPEGYEPINYQPKTTTLSVFKEGDKVILRAIRSRPYEELKIVFTRVYSAVAFKTHFKPKFIMYGKEEDLRRAVVRNPALIEEGLRVVEIERKVRPGFIDLLCVDREGRLVVIEFKREEASVSAVRQLYEYVKALSNELRRPVRGILASPRISKDARSLLATLGLEYKRLDLRKCMKYMAETGLEKFIKQ